MDYFHWRHVTLASGDVLTHRLTSYWTNRRPWHHFRRAICEHFAYLFYSRVINTALVAVYRKLVPLGSARKYNTTLFRWTKMVFSILLFILSFSHLVLMYVYLPFMSTPAPTPSPALHLDKRGHPSFPVVRWTDGICELPDHRWFAAMRISLGAMTIRDGRH